MSQISEHLNSSNDKIHSRDQVSKIIVKLGVNKCKNNYTYTFQLARLQNWLLMSIFDTPEQDLSNFDWKYDKKMLRTYSVKSSSTLFSCLMRAIYSVEVLFSWY